MKVSELIAELEKLDEKLPVIVYNYADGNDSEIVNVEHILAMWGRESGGFVRLVL